jgi:hypothetical protein
VDAMGDSVLFDACGETAAQAATAALTRHGYRVVRSFDLRSALTTHADCECPYHGTAQCTCQFVVLLVYSEAGDPVVVTAHSRDTLACVQIVRPAGGTCGDDATTRSDPRLADKVMPALVEAALTLQVGPVEEVVADAE